MRENISSIDDLLVCSSFIRWVKGRSMPAEARLWDEWINQAPAHREMAREAQQEILGIDFLADEFPAVDHHQEWKALEGRIGQTRTLNTDTYTYRPSTRTGTHWIFRIAAVLLIVAGTSYAAHLHFLDRKASQTEQEITRWETIETEYRQQKTISLSDGSTIMLNANSTLTYPAGWMRGGATEVYLEGEAYFSITSRKESNQTPFRVITDDGTIEVVGTKFVVASSEQDTRVGLEEGQVIIKKETAAEPRDDTGEATRQYVMEPGQVAHLTKNSAGVDIKDSSNIDVFTSWVDQKIILESSPLSYLIYRIEQTFGVEVIVRDDTLNDRRLTGTLKLRELDHLVTSISEVMDIEVSLAKGKVYFGKS